MRTATEVVLPPCVGMVRNAKPATSGWNGSPHVRGDGPLRVHGEAWIREFSPRAWGWSDNQMHRLGAVPK